MERWTEEGEREREELGSQSDPRDLSVPRLSASLLRTSDNSTAEAGPRVSDVLSSVFLGGKPKR